MNLLTAYLPGQKAEAWIGDHAYTKRYAGDEPYWYRRNGKPKTLIYFCHSWSGNLDQTDDYPAFKDIPDCTIVGGNFGGPNNHAEGGGHPNQMERIRRVLDKEKSERGYERTIVFGASGGGYVTLQFLATNPAYVDGFVSWLPINNMIEWWSENAALGGGECPAIEACMGGVPTGRESTYLSRSPCSGLAAVSGKQGYIRTGQNDTTTQPHHGYDAYQLLAANNTVDYLEIPAWGHDFDSAEAVSQINVLIAAL